TASGDVGQEGRNVITNRVGRNVITWLMINVSIWGVMSIHKDIGVSRCVDLIMSIHIAFGPGENWRRVDIVEAPHHIRPLYSLLLLREHFQQCSYQKNIRATFLKRKYMS